MFENLKVSITQRVLSLIQSIDEQAFRREEERVRQAIAEQYPEEVYTRGFRVYTTLRKADQEAAYAALRKGVLEYDRAHGYRAPEGYTELPANVGEERLRAGAPARIARAVFQRQHGGQVFPMQPFDEHVKHIAGRSPGAAVAFRNNRPEAVDENAPRSDLRRL